MKAKVIEVSREEARKMVAAGTLPKGHATLNELSNPKNVVYHIAGTPAHDYRIYRS